MAYIGKTPVIGNFQKCDSISVVNGQAAYTLQVGGVNVSPQSENHMLVSLNGILQAPVTSFTVSGSTLTFASNLVTGDVIDFVMILGNVLDLGVPSDNTVSLAKLTATGTKDATTFLRGDNTFSTISAGITEIDMWRKTSGSSGNQTTVTGWERPDNGSFGYLGTGMTESSGIFTFPSTGIWSIQYVARVALDGTGSSRHLYAGIEVTTDNSTYIEVAEGDAGVTDVDASDENSNAVTEYFFDVTNTSTHKCKFNFSHIATGGTAYIQGDTNKNITYVRFIRYGDT